MAGENTPLLTTTVKFAKPSDNNENISHRFRSTMAKASFRLNSLIEEHTGTEDFMFVETFYLSSSFAFTHLFSRSHLPYTYNKRIHRHAGFTCHCGQFTHRARHALTTGDLYSFGHHTHMRGTPICGSIVIALFHALGQYH
jgi:hypothetical protein